VSVDGCAEPHRIGRLLQSDLDPERPCHGIGLRSDLSTVTARTGRGSCEIVSTPPSQAASRAAAAATRTAGRIKRSAPVRSLRLPAGMVDLAAFCRALTQSAAQAPCSLAMQFGEPVRLTNPHGNTDSRDTRRLVTQRRHSAAPVRVSYQA
jgi:hypothetical protein